MNTEIISDTESNPADASTNDAAADAVATVRILGTSTCASLSGKSTLTYTISMDTEGQSQIALLCNDGRGYLNTDAIAFKDIQAELAKQPHEITSGSLRCLYPNKSNNSPGFLLAVLKAVGLVQVAVAFADGQQWWLTQDEERLLETHNNSHRVVSAVRERILNAVNLKPTLDTALSPVTAIDLLTAIGVHFPTNPQCKEAAGVLRELFGEPKRINGKMCWRVSLKYRHAPKIPFLGAPSAEAPDDIY